MAIVGSAHVVIRALTDKLQDDIQKGLQNSVPAANSSGQALGRALSNGINKNLDVDLSNVANNVASVAGDAGRSAGDAIEDGVEGGMRRGAQSGGREVEKAARGSGGRAGNIFSRSFSSSGGRANRIFISMALRIAALVPIIAVLVGSISSLVSGLFAMGAAAANAAYSLAALPGILTAVIQAAGVGLIAFGGVGEALSAGLKATSTKATGSLGKLQDTARESGNRVRDAIEGVADAERDAARAIAAAQRQVRDAKEALAETYFTTARAERDAIESVSDAEEELRDQHERVRDAQEALTQARKEAREELIDLQFQERSGAISQQRAIFALQDARFQLNATSELPADNRIRQEAVLAFQEAQLNLEQTREANGDTAESLRDIRQTGVDNTEAIRDAQEDLRDAIEGVSDATRGHNDAIVAQTRLQGENTRAIRDAREALADARQALADAFREGPRQIRDAKEALQEARKAGADAAIALQQGGTAANAYADALAKLSPPARRFVEFLISMKDEFASLKIAAQETLFPRLEIAIRNLVEGPLFPKLREMFRGTGAAIGDSAISISKALNSGPFVRSFGRVTEQNEWIIRALGRSVGNLARAFFAMMDAARPLTRELVKWFVGWTRNLRISTEAKNKTGELTKTFVDAGDQMQQLIRITKNLWEGIKDLGREATPAGQSLLDSFEKATKAFANFTDTRKNRVMLRQFFADVATNVRALSSLFLVVGGVLARLGADPTIGKMATALEPVVLRIEELFTTMLDTTGEDLIKLVDAVVIAFTEISESGAIAVFLATMTTAIRALIFALNVPVLGDGLKTLLAIGAALYALSILRNFPGISLLSKGLAAGFAKNADGVRGFTRLKTAIMGAASGARTFAVAAATNIKALAIQSAQLVKNGALWTAQKAKMLAAAAAAKIVAAAQKAWAAAQWLLNAAMSANPLGLIIIGLVAVGAALYLAYKKFEGFRNVVNAVFGAIVTAGKWLWNFLMGNSLIPDIVDAFQWLWDKAKPIFKGIASVILTLVDAGVWLYNKLMPVFRLIGKAVKLYITAIIIVVKTLVKFFATKILPVVAWLYNNVIKRYFKIMAFVIGTYIKVAITIIKALIKFFTSTLPNAVRKVIDFVKNNWRLIASILFGPVGIAVALITKHWDTIKRVFSTVLSWVTGSFKASWRILKAIIVTPIQLARTGISKVWGNIKTGFRVIKDWVLGAFRTAWGKAKSMLIGPINAAKDLIGKVFGSNGPIRRFFSSVKDWVVTRFKLGWAVVKAVFMKPIETARDLISNVFGANGPIRRFFTGVKDWVVTRFKATWDKVKSTIMDPLNFVKEKIQNLFGEDGPIRKAFRLAVAGIKTIWDGLERIAKAPVKFVVNTVYNQGIRRVVNLIPGVDNLSPYTVNWASGTSSVLPGYTPGRDVHNFVSRDGKMALNLSGGEGIVRPEVVQALTPQGVDSLNKAARSGGASAIRRVLGGGGHGSHHANGGIIPSIRKSLSFFLGGVLPLDYASDIKRHTSGYSSMPWAGDLNSPYDLSNPPSAIRAWKAGVVAHSFTGYGDSHGRYGNHLMIDHGGQSTLYAHLSSFAPGIYGKQVGAGAFIGRVGETGNADGAHLHFEVRGGGVTGAGQLGGTAGGNAVSAALNQARKKAEEWKKAITGIKESLGTMPNNLKRLKAMEGWGDMMRQSTGSIGDKVIGWINDKIPNYIKIGRAPKIDLPDDPIRSPFDFGGMARGRGYLGKDTIRPERVLSPRQTEDFSRLVDALDRLSSRPTNDNKSRGDIKIDMHAPHDASPREIVDMLVYELRRAAWGGKY